MPNARVIDGTNLELRPGGTVKFEGAAYGSEASFFHTKNEPGTGASIGVLAMRGAENPGEHPVLDVRKQALRSGYGRLTLITPEPKLGQCRRCFRQVLGQIAPPVDSAGKQPCALALLP